ncbi:hypothetical protein ACFV5E_39205 [Streptomyces chartreusis]|uniref:hypothetical protein n=1 Tax=Streptomyces chartreusis TaxID=1969 RepID=UPI0036D1E0D1
MNGAEQAFGHDHQEPQRPFFIIGQWSGADVKVWAVLEAPPGADERADAWEECALEAEDAFGSMEVVFAASAAEAERAVRREAAETAVLSVLRSRRSGAGSHRRVSHYYS